MDDLDEIAVERAARGERLHLTKAERAAAVALRRRVVAALTRQGVSGRAIGERLGMSRRQVVRHRMSHLRMVIEP